MSFLFCGDAPMLCIGALSMPRGSAPIIPRGSAFRICLWQIHGSRRRAGARGLSHAEGRFCGDTRLQGMRFSFSTPVSGADSHFQGHAACAFGSGRWLRCFKSLSDFREAQRTGRLRVAPAWQMRVEVCVRALCVAGWPSVSWDCSP